MTTQRLALAKRVSLQWRALADRLSSALLALVALSLIVLGRIDPALIQDIRVRIGDATAPLLTMVRTPLGSLSGSIDRTRGLFDLAEENARLRAENQTLREWQSAAYRLEAQNRVMRGMLQLGPAQPPVVRSEPVIAEPGGVYMRSVLVAGGAHDGLAKGQAAMVGAGLIGRITEIGAWSARVLLVTDLNSRIPVLLEGTRTHAILAGDNTPEPTLVYYPKAAQISVGDRVVTAGHDGVFPTGLAIGRVSQVENGVIRVAPLADLDRLEFVQLIDGAAQSALTPEEAPATP